MTVNKSLPLHKQCRCFFRRKTHFQPFSYRLFFFFLETCSLRCFWGIHIFMYLMFQCSELYISIPIFFIVRWKQNSRFTTTCVADSNGMQVKYYILERKKTLFDAVRPDSLPWMAKEEGTMRGDLKRTKSLEKSWWKFAFLFIHAFILRRFPSPLCPVFFLLLASPQSSGSMMCMFTLHASCMLWSSQSVSIALCHILL